MYLTGDTTNYNYANLVLAEGQALQYTRISSGTDREGAVMEHTATPTRFSSAPARRGAGPPSAGSGKPRPERERDRAIRALLTEAYSAGILPDFGWGSSALEGMYLMTA